MAEYYAGGSADLAGGAPNGGSAQTGGTDDATEGGSTPAGSGSSGGALASGGAASGGLASGGSLVAGSEATGGQPTAASDVGACQGKAGMPGTTSRSLMVNGTMRTFVQHVPATLDPNLPAPVVLMQHGATMTGESADDMAKWSMLADREGFIAIMTNAEESGGTWQLAPDGAELCGLGGLANGTSDDIGFVKAVVADLQVSQCVDEEAVFATGFSLGAYFTNHLGCQAGGFVRAIAPHSGGTYDGVCTDTPTPVMLVHGDVDAIVPYECATDARSLWVTRNGCSEDVDVREVAGGFCEWHKGCPENGQVVLCTFHAMGHGWAGATEGGAFAGGPQFESATELIWSFFKDQQ